MRKEEYDNIAAAKEGEILDDNALHILEDRLNVEVVYINFEELVYVCVLERMGVRHKRGDLENAIAVIADLVHARYRRDRPAMTDNRITRKESKRREMKKAGKV
jgi:hypothetical protein